MLAESYGDDFYIASAAHSLAAEFGGWFPWSMRDSALGPMLDIRHYFYSGGYDPGVEGYIINMSDAVQSDFVQGAAVSSTPEYSLRFLLANNIIGGTRQRTIGKLIEWSRENLAHFIGGFEQRNLSAIWQYPGFPPVSRIIEGTVSSDHPQYGRQNWTAGCHGTMGFFKALLRHVNIPVVRGESGGHAGVCFPSEFKCLAHGDDPYGALSEGDYPGEELLISRFTYDRWFGPQYDYSHCDWWWFEECAPTVVPNDTAYLNVGRASAEVALKHLPPYLLGAHCRDLSTNTPRDQGRVFALYSQWYSFSSLNNSGVFERIDAKLSNVSGA